MRISDWSSDVCSSDLDTRGVAANIGRRRLAGDVLSLFADDRDQFRLMMEDARGYIWQNDRIAGADDRIRRLEEGPDWEGRALCSLEIVRSHGENFAGPRHRRHEPDARERTPFARGQSLFHSRAQRLEPGHTANDAAGPLDP